MSRLSPFCTAIALRARRSRRTARQWRSLTRSRVGRRRKLGSRFRATGDTFFAIAFEARPVWARRPIPRWPWPGGRLRFPGRLARPMEVNRKGGQSIRTPERPASSVLAGSSESLSHELNPEDTRPHRPMKALVADDDATTCALLCAVLDELGHESEAVADGNTAWRRFQDTKPPLVVLDIIMPGLDGIEVCRRIRQMDEKHETFILVLTGRDQPGDLAAVLDAGADDYVAKPASAEHLRARLVIAERRSAQDVARRKAEAELA